MKQTLSLQTTYFNVVISMFNMNLGKGVNRGAIYGLMIS